MSRKAAYGAAALIGLAAIVYSAIWWISADRLRGELDGRAADMRANGWSVSYDRVRIDGYPVSVTATVDAPSIAAPRSAGGWSWRGPRSTATIRPWNPWRIVLDGAGAHRLRLADKEREPIRVTVGSSFGLILFLAEARATKIVLNLEDVAIDATVDGLPKNIEEADATILLPEQPGRADRGRGFEPPGPTIALRLENIQFSRVEATGHGFGIEEASWTAKLIGPVPREATARALAVWRDGGGTLEIANASIRSQGASARGSGTVALDRDLQPLAALSIRIEGYRELLRALVTQGWMKRNDAGAIRLGLDLVAGASSGRKGEIAMPLTIQDRRLSFGPISVTQLPRIDWGG